MKFDNVKDFICSMPITAAIADTAKYNEKVYGFCSTGCKDEFKKNPASYLATK
jgi:YHS domain-containing protein